MDLEVWGALISFVAFLVAGIVTAYSWRKQHEFALAVLVWVLLAWVLARQGFFEGERAFAEGDFVGFIMLGTLMVAPLIALFLAWRYVIPFRRFANSIPAHHLIALQVYRVAGMIFLWMMTVDLMPPLMGWMTGIADLTVGVLAFPLAFALEKNAARWRNAAIAWNIFGIADFVLAISVVSLSIFGVLALQPEPVMIGKYPLAIISLFQVPLSIGIHALALRHLLAK